MDQHLRAIQFLKAWCCSAPRHTRQKHHLVDEPDIAALLPSAVLDAQMPPRPRADQPINDDDELSDLDFAIADLVAAAEAANMEEEPMAIPTPPTAPSNESPFRPIISDRRAAVEAVERWLYRQSVSKSRWRSRKAGHLGPTTVAELNQWPAHLSASIRAKESMKADSI